MYCPKINYCFVEDDIRTLNERIKTIAKDYRDEETGWFDVSEKDHLVFVDEQDNMFTIYLLGRFWRKDENDFEIEYIILEKDGISFSFEKNIFDDHL